jgi:hypothetical protein
MVCFHSRLLRVLTLFESGRTGRLAVPDLEARTLNAHGTFPIQQPTFTGHERSIQCEIAER